VGPYTTPTTYKWNNDERCRWKQEDFETAVNVVKGKQWVSMVPEEPF
jgi:hypothetical protein